MKRTITTVIGCLPAVGMVLVLGLMAQEYHYPKPLTEPGTSTMFTVVQPKVGDCLLVQSANVLKIIPCQPSGAPELGWLHGNTLNRQCPVCGEMAQKYVPVTTNCADYNSGQPASAIGLWGCEPRQIVVRCHRCNAAFWIDEEGPANAH